MNFNFRLMCLAAWTLTGAPIQGISGGFLLYYETNKTDVAALTAAGAGQALDSFTIPVGKLRVGDTVKIEATLARTDAAPPMMKVTQ